MEFHQPVLVEEVLKHLDVIRGSIYIDATLGHGGHTIEILKKGGIVYGIDQDPGSLLIAQNRIAQAGLDHNFFPINANFNNLQNLIGSVIPKNISGLIFDLGLNSQQQKSSNRGFSFNDDLSLDMRLDPTTQTLTAEYIINTYSYQQLYDIFTKLAQEEFSKPLILRIIRARQEKPIKSSKRLADIIRDYYQQKHHTGHIDPSTKIFMALRICVNNELDNLKTFLKNSLEILPKNCVIVVISFHSGEDRIVKQFIRQYSLIGKILNLTKKPAITTPAEVRTNPLSRSAILRSYKII